MRALILAAALTTLTALVVTAGAAAPADDCTKVGTSADNVMAGGHGPDVICARGGDDYVAGNGGNDVLRGGSGGDTLVGGQGRDQLFGKKGRDQLFLVDGHTGGLADGGPGHDHCYVDEGDHARHCEEIFRGPSMPAVNGLAGAFFGQASLAETLISETPAPTTPPPPPGTVTITVTQTVTQTVTPPQCTPPPASPPPSC